MRKQKNKKDENSFRDYGLRIRAGRSSKRIRIRSVWCCNLEDTGRLRTVAESGWAKMVYRCQNWMAFTVCSEIQGLNGTVCSEWVCSGWHWPSHLSLRWPWMVIRYIRRSLFLLLEEAILNFNLNISICWPMILADRTRRSDEDWPSIDRRLNMHGRLRELNHFASNTVPSTVYSEQWQAILDQNYAYKQFRTERTL